MRFSIMIGVVGLAAAQPAAAQPAGGMSAPPPSPETYTGAVAVNRARLNYDAILRGEKRLVDLTPTEQDEVRELDKRMRAARPPEIRDAYERCLDDETEKLGREPTALDQRTFEMRCR